jgi:hypothetical protein
LSPSIRSQTPPTELMPAHLTFKDISNATTSDGEQLTGHVIAAAVLPDVDPAFQVWTRLRVSCEPVQGCDFVPGAVSAGQSLPELSCEPGQGFDFVSDAVFEGHSLSVLSTSLASVEWHAMHSAEECARCCSPHLPRHERDPSHRS